MLMPLADAHNYLFYGDNLEILRQRIPDDSVDLCYIDPPFNSKRTYFQIYNRIGFDDVAQAQAFIDTWVWGPEADQGVQEILDNAQGRFPPQTVALIQGLRDVLGAGGLMAYLVHMTLRITEIHRVLKPTGSFYLHCDPTASHYLKLILDAVFCSQGGDFQNEIIWHYSGWNGNRQQHLNRRHDVILFYTKSRVGTFHPPSIPWASEDEYVQTRRQKIHYDAQNRSYVLSDGGHGKRVARYLAEAMQYGKPLDDVWDLAKLNNSAREHLGYPTQKPEALLERIIQASSNPGDTVLDAYCGCGTTVAVAQRLGRRWIGIDITYQAISLILKRLDDSTPDNQRAALHDHLIMHGVPRDLASAQALAHDSRDKTRKEFEKWAILTYTNNRARIQHKKGADGGIDGVAAFVIGPSHSAKALFQVKSGHVNRATVATLRGDMAREQAELGILLTLQKPTKPMIQEAAAAGSYTHPLFPSRQPEPRIRLVTIEELVDQHVRWMMPMTHDAVKSAQTANKSLKDDQIRWS